LLYPSTPAASFCQRAHYSIRVQQRLLSCANSVLQCDGYDGSAHLAGEVDGVGGVVSCIC
jgi:hypothetical protein